MERQKNRRYQFSLFVITTAAAVGAAWLSHRSYCLRQWSRYEQAGDRIVLEGSLGPNATEADRQAWKRKMAYEALLRDHPSRLAKQYRHAIWFPWERLWIDESPPQLEATQ